MSPTKPTPGSQVKLQVTGCDGNTGAAKSRAFVADAALSQPDDDQDAPLAGEATVRSTAAPGGYRITVSCDGEDKAKGTLTVVASDENEDEDQARQKQVKQSQSPRPSPTAPVRAGGGGTAELAADSTADRAASEGPGARHAVIGLLLASAAALAVTGRLVRRRRRPE
ncbi:hypothetical protein [Streptomyces sp. YIM 130001]|uniref:hypothetical protein n=1 Tax=Streptomyces sp. YIM 130001 TaxID=2259644 RepID=UPI001F08F776|nr:hypothetical protein [Streptomyces sp. YIM 130001]